MSSSLKTNELKTTPLHQVHVQAGARMVDFSGWDMPLHYGSQIEEHKEVRERAGLFDVSHMAAVDIAGAGSLEFLQHLLANNVARLSAGAALYSLMLNAEGGVVDDLLAYRQGDQAFRLVINAGNRQSDMAWITAVAKDFAVQIQLRDDLGILALQGPAAESTLLAAFPQYRHAVQSLPRFSSVNLDGVMVARTGYTGEDGFELLVPAHELEGLWNSLVAAGAAPCGLGARDTLRLEAGMCLYGHEMDEHTSPLEAGLEWTIAWQPETRHFIGRAALEAQKVRGVQHKLVGLELLDRGVLRQGQVVWFGNQPAGVITSGSFSPVLGKSIALARVAVSVSGEVLVEMRDKRLAALVRRPPFVRKDK